jgi:phosphoribosylformylglycinamidine (FGAM) synthase-like enzyme
LAPAGLSNAIPELLHDSAVGGTIDLTRIPSVDPSLSPMQLWCNESQERYVLGVAPEDLEAFEALCARERCPFAVVGTATAEERLVVAAPGQAPVIDMPMDLLFGKAPKTHRDTRIRRPRAGPSSMLRSSTCARPDCACSRIRRLRRRISWSRSAIAPWADCARATRWSAPGSCRWPTARSA